uniref:Uncharacterized protein n=1 Tax=Micrurus lemniscatus lemniscatus TaxID=129467 RepID=A0A2D4IZA4_MICLE
MKVMVANFTRNVRKRIVSMGTYLCLKLLITRSCTFKTPMFQRSQLQLIKQMGKAYSLVIEDVLQAEDIKFYLQYFHVNLDICSYIEVLVLFFTKKSPNAPQQFFV